MAMMVRQTDSGVSMGYNEILLSEFHWIHYFSHSTRTFNR
jgi:hypothetical protein